MGDIQRKTAGYTPLNASIWIYDRMVPGSSTSKNKGANVQKAKVCFFRWAGSYRDIIQFDEQIVQTG